MRKTALITLLLLAVIFLSSCITVSMVTAQTIPPVNSPATQVTIDVTPAPALTPINSASSTTSANTSEPSVAEGEKIVLTTKQNDNIKALLTGALSMSGDSENGEFVTFFQDADALSVNDLLGFAYVILNDESEYVGGKYMDSGSVNSKTIQNIILSAFGVDYLPQKGDGIGENFHYNGSSFMFEGSDGITIDPYPYSTARQPSGSLQVKFDIAYNGIPQDYYLGKGEAVLQEDANSLFGYRIVSLTEGNVADLSFTSVEASSCFPAENLKTYTATNAIDGNDSTAWVPKTGKGEWIKLSFDKPQNISGLILHFGDWSSDDAFEEHDLPSLFRLDFSDGTFLADEEIMLDGIGENPCDIFDNVKNTSYVKLTITDTTKGAAGFEGVYISEVKPF